MREQPGLDMFPPVKTPTDFTWDALRSLCLVEPAVQLAARLAERGDLTREQALIWLAFSLYNQKSALFATLVEQKATPMLLATTQLNPPVKKDEGQHHDG